MKRWRAVIVALVLAIPLAGCAYRLRSPAALGESLRVQTVADQGRFPRAGALLQAATAQAIPAITGWQVRPDGSARLDLSIDRDGVRSKADDSRGVPIRWEIELHGTALLVSRHGNRTYRFSGIGYASGRDQEQVALNAAANNAGAWIAHWLDLIDLAAPGKKP